MYRSRRNVRLLMIQVAMDVLKLTRSAAKARLSKEATFRSRTAQTGTVLAKPEENVRAVIPHFMSDLKRVACRAFY